MIRLAVIPGDGIGPEVVAEGLKVLKATGVTHESVTYPFGAEHYLATGELVPRSALDELRGMDAIYLGAVGDPRVPASVLELGVLVAIGHALDLFVNVRPTRVRAARLCPLRDVRPEDVDLVLVREATEDCYGPGRFVRRATPYEVALGTMVYTRSGTERAFRHAFELARRRTRKRVTLVHQANAIGAHELLVRAFESVATDYPDVEADEAFPDGAAMWLVREPARFDVIVTTSFIGGILSDLAAALAGGLGQSASARLHPGRVSLFEPTHGSAPKYAGQGVASPIGAILAMAMLLEAVGETAAAARIDGAVTRLLETARIPSVDARSGLTTAEVGDLVAGEVGLR